MPTRPLSVLLIGLTTLVPSFDSSGSQTTSQAQIVWQFEAGG
jgi:hypothetical protein